MPKLISDAASLGHPATAATPDGKPHAVSSESLRVKTLGPCRVESPLAGALSETRQTVHRVDEADKVLFDDTLSAVTARGLDVTALPGFEPAGPRRHIYFDPSKARAAVVTCGGLCPGQNNVIRAIVLELIHRYKVRTVYGICNGYQGFIARYQRPVVDLTARFVSRINEQGGTILGASRGQQDPAEIVDCLERMSISMLFVVGGDGTMRGALRIVDEIERRNAKIAVVGVPKTIDNDIMYIDQSFGFQTAFATAVDVIRSAHVEAKAAPNGVGLVRVMGRHSGFIACYATLATGDANFTLIPEVPFCLDGQDGFLEVLRRRLDESGHAVIVVAEGAGQDLLDSVPEQTDASGNARLGDIGDLLRCRILQQFDEWQMELNLKYFDPSYSIRSVPANPFDSVYCLRLGHNAVHAALSGRTAMMVGRWHGRFVHVPMRLAVRERFQVDPYGDLWMSVLEATGQPRMIETERT